MFDPVISSLPAFAGYFATAVGLLAVFVVLYVFVTPYSELALIREGNTAAAVSLGGAIVGYAMPIAVSVAAPAMLISGGGTTPHRFAAKATTSCGGAGSLSVTL